MARMPGNGLDPQRANAPQTLAEMVFPLSSPAKRREAESFRIKFEAAYGPTDLTKRYTSMWPPAEQEWLIKNETKRYFDGLPPFAKAYLRGKMEMAARDGSLDDMPDSLLRLYILGEMRLDHEVRDR